MKQGTVMWFNQQKGYGFIHPQAGGRDVFVHASVVREAGLGDLLYEGQVIKYEEDDNGATIIMAERSERKMSKGRVKWFNRIKGYGFIQPEAGGQDVFLHISAVERAGLVGNLNPGQAIEYEEVLSRGRRLTADHLRIVMEHLK
jgi:CspA family cold shock protein